MSSLSAFGFKPNAAAAKQTHAAAADAPSPPKHHASSKRVRAAAPKPEAAAAAHNKKTPAGGKSMVQAMLCFGAAASATAAAAASSCERIDLIDEEPASVTAAPASRSSAAAAPRRSPRKPTAMDTEAASAASSSAASSAPAVRSVLSFVKPPAPAPAAAAAAAVSKMKKARAPRKRKETAQSSESEADDAEEEQPESAVAQPAASAKRRKRAEESASAATPSRRARAPSSAASASSATAMIDDDADAVVIPEEAPRRSGRAAAAGSRHRRSYKEKEENEGLSGGEEEADAVGESTAARAAPVRSSVAAAASSSSASSPRKGRAVRAGVTAPLFAAPLPAYLAFGEGAVAAAADSYARSQLHRPLSDRPVNVLLALRARSSSSASHSRFDGGNLPLFYARQRSNGIEINRATRATMQTLLSNEPVTAIPHTPSAAASIPHSPALTTVPSAFTLHGSSFGSSFDQAGLSSLPRMLLARTAPAYRGSSAESGLPIVVRNRWDQGAGAGLAASAFKAYALNYSPCGRMLAAAGHGGVVKVFHRSPAGVAAPHLSQESVCEDNGAVLSPFEADHMAPITSFVAHARWASAVKFVPNRSDGAASARSFGDGSGSMLLSTSDDSTLKLWSLDSLLAGEAEGAASALATSSLFVHRPKPIDSLSPHDLGIYDFDCIAAGSGSGETSIATASKDGHVALSTLTAAGLRRLGCLSSGDPESDSAHKGVVKSVAWRDPFTLGSAGGNDKIVCVYDVRAGGAGSRSGGSSGRGSCVARVSGLHALSIHTFRWNPSDACGHQFLTAASDCLIQLCDLRLVGRGPLFTLAQHFPPSVTRSDTMYKPVYAFEGSMVITASSSQSLHVYSSTNGDLLRTLPLGYSTQQLASFDDPADGSHGFCTYSKRLLHHVDFKTRR